MTTTNRQPTTVPTYETTVKTERVFVHEANLLYREIRFSRAGQPAMTWAAADKAINALDPWPGREYRMNAEIDVMTVTEIRDGQRAAIHTMIVGARIAD